MAESRHRALDGWRIVVLRPKSAGCQLAEALQSAGAEVILLPTLAIELVPVDATQRQLAMDLDQFDFVIVTSPNAADFGLQLLDQYWPQWPVGISWMAIGNTTAQRLKAQGIEAVTAGQHQLSGSTSEALLQLPSLAAPLTHKKVLLLKGEGGRNKLSDELDRRGAKVSALMVYRRVLPEYDNDAFDQALVNFNPNCILSLSGETLHNLFRLSHNSDRLINSTVLVPSQRVANIAQDYGWQDIITLAEIDQITIIETLSRLQPSVA